MASSVSIPARRNSSSPEPSVNVSGVEDEVVRPHAVLVRRRVSWIRRAIASFSLRRSSPFPVRRSSGRPPRRRTSCRAATTLCSRSSPSSRLIELTIAFPPISCRASSMTGGFGGIDHDRERDLRVEPRDDLPHVARFIPADVRRADVHHVGPLLRRVLPHRRRSLPNPRPRGGRGIACSRSRWSARRPARGPGRCGTATVW